MILFWSSIVGLKPKRFTIADSLRITTCVVIYLTPSLCRVVLPLLILLNLLTLLAMLIGLAVAMGRAYRFSKAGLGREGLA